MKTLDDAWNAQDWYTFSQRHIHDVIMRWPDQPPTEGIEAHSTNVAHIKLRVYDIERSLNFYERILGFSSIRKSPI
jgi:catechol-2,3-dioxygenase